MAVVAGDYQSSYMACCIYLGREAAAKQITSEDDLVAICDALMAESNNWFFVNKDDRHSFVDSIGMRHEPNTFCFNENLYAGHLRSVPAYERGAILRMIATHIVTTYESHAAAQV